MGLPPALRACLTKGGYTETLRRRKLPAEPSRRRRTDPLSPAGPPARPACRRRSIESPLSDASKALEASTVGNSIQGRQPASVRARLLRAMLPTGHRRMIARRCKPDASRYWRTGRMWYWSAPRRVHGAVAAGHPIIRDRAQLEDIAGPADIRGVAVEDVPGAPALHQPVHLETGSRRRYAAVRPDRQATPPARDMAGTSSR